MKSQFFAVYNFNFRLETIFKLKPGLLDFFFPNGKEPSAVNLLYQLKATVKEFLFFRSEFLQLQVSTSLATMDTPEIVRPVFES